MTYALEMAAMGFGVFPISTNSKQPPPGSRGFKDATTDDFTIMAWWEENPDYNIGVWPGEHYMVLDVDVKRGRNGRKTLARLEAENADLPGTLLVETPSGGLHLYFKTTRPVPNSAGRIGPALDVRGAHGYVLGPGSTIGGRTYRVVTPGPVADAPDWLRDAAGEQAADGGATPAQAVRVEADTPRAISRAREFLEQTAPAIEGQGGDEWTYKTACIVRDYGVTEATALQLMLDHWNERCEPPWDEDDLATKVRNAYAYAKLANDPRGETPEQVFGEIINLDEHRPETDSGNDFARLYMNEEALEMAGRKPPEWLINDTIPDKALVVTYGAYDTYKSFLMLDLALHATRGLPWAGHQPVDRLPVIYLAGEGQTALAQRVAAWRSHHRDLATIPSRFFLLPVMPVFNQYNVFNQFIESAKPLKPRVVFVDTVARAMAGLSQNDDKDMGVFLNRCAEIQARLDCTVVAVHHTPKGSKDEMKGSVALPAGADTVIRIDKPREREALVSVMKQRGAEKWPSPQGFKAVTVEMKDDQDNRWTSLIFEPAAVQKKAEPKEALDILRYRIVEELLRFSPFITMKTNELAAEVAQRTSDDQQRTYQWLSKQATRGTGAVAVAFYTGDGVWCHPERLEELKEAQGEATSEE